MTYPESLKVIRLKTCSSTNSYLLDHIDRLEKKFPILVTADTQTRGRGRGDRAWISKEGLGVYSTFGFCLPEARYLSLLSMTTGVAVADTLAEVSGKEFCLKWPNDVLYRGKKIAGILIENKVLRDRVICVAGMGINVNHQIHDFGKELKPYAVSLKMITGRTVPPEIVNVRLSHFYLQAIEALQSFEGRNKMIKKAAHLSRNLRGKEVTFYGGDGVVRAVFLGIDPDGGVILRTKSGIDKVFYSGEIIPD